MDRTKNDTRETWKALGTLGHLGLTIGGAVLAGALLGNWIDGVLETRPLFLLGLAFLFVAGAAWEGWRTLRRYADRDADPPPSGGP